MRAFLDALIPDSYEINNYYIPELNSYKYDNYGENHLFSSSRNNIAVERHNRYTPPFRHSHTFFEMIYVYKGSCENTIENKTIVMEQGNICIVAPGVSHSISIFDESTVVNILIKKTTFNETFFQYLQITTLSLTFSRQYYIQT